MSASMLDVESCFGRATIYRLRVNHYVWLRQLCMYANGRLGHRDKDTHEHVIKSMIGRFCVCNNDDIITWRRYPHYKHFVRRIRRFPEVYHNKVSIVQRFDVFFATNRNKLFHKQLSCRWSKTPWRWYDVSVISPLMCIAFQYISNPCFLYDPQWLWPWIKSISGSML